jgi:hypothetical protein
MNFNFFLIICLFFQNINSQQEEKIIYIDDDEAHGIHLQIFMKYNTLIKTIQTNVDSTYQPFIDANLKSAYNSKYKLEKFLDIMKSLRTYLEKNYLNINFIIELDQLINELTQLKLQKNAPSLDNINNDNINNNSCEGCRINNNCFTILNCRDLLIIFITILIVIVGCCLILIIYGLRKKKNKLKNNINTNINDINEINNNEYKRANLNTLESNIKNDEGNMVIELAQDKEVQHSNKNKSFISNK